MNQSPPILDAWYLTGPTASGKTAVGIELARIIDAEIISLDSMAVYRGMDIGTAKSAVSERGNVPHHMIDLVEPTDDYSIDEYLTAAHRCVEEIRGRRREVLFVGGTPLYLNALLRGLASGPPADAAIRERLQQEANAEGPETLHALLTEVDPDSADRIHPRDARRIIRALEVFELTGRPISADQSHFDRSEAAAVRRMFVLDWPRGVLHERINQRVDAMFAGGLEDEVKQLLKHHDALGRTALQAVGYKEVMACLRGECDREFAMERTKARTRQFARRQLIWFRSMPECRWISVNEPFDPAAVADKIISRSESQ